MTLLGKKTYNRQEKGDGILLVKVDIFSGFLGAGKTTLIKKLIAEGAYAGEKLMLIENEFGEIAVDGGFLRDAGIEITEMNQGCICCSLVGDFSAAMQKVIEQFTPDRILVEPSGVGKLSDVARAVENVPGALLTGLITVADASKCKLYRKNFGEFYVDQVEHAACIVLSRTERISPEKLAESVALIRELNPNAAIITTPWSMLGAMQIREAMCAGIGSLFGTAGRVKTLRAMRGRKRAPLPHSHGEQAAQRHHADDVFGSFGMEVQRPYSVVQIEKALHALEDADKYGTVLRAKGIVRGEAGWVDFDYVPGEIDVRTGSPDITGRLCVIGTGLKREALRTLFTEVA